MPAVVAPFPTVETSFDRNVDPDLITRALAPAKFGSMWLDDDLLGERRRYPRLPGMMSCDLLVVGGGYTGLWAALHAAERNPGSRIVLIEAERIGWAASGRNGGFVDPSLTHGAENGKSRWPNEFDQLERLAKDNFDGMQGDITAYEMAVEWERTGMLTVATEHHQVDWLREAGQEGEGTFLDRDAVRAEVNSPTYRAGLFSPDCAIVNPGRLAVELARACEQRGVQIYEQTPARAISSDAGAVKVATGAGTVTADRVVLATNVFRSLLRRNRPYTIPVYDYVLATEPLTEAQLDRIGWRSRQGLSDPANQFHYYRLSADNRVLWGGYDAIYHYGRHIDSRYEDRPESFRKLAAHFFLTFPQLDDVRFSHRWAGAIDANSRFCAHWGLAQRGRVAYANGFTGLGVAAARFAADVCLDLLEGVPTPRTELEMVRRRPMPFPPEPVASAGIQATRWSLDRADHHAGRRNLFLRTLDQMGLGFDS